MDRRLCKRLRNLPTKQDYDSQKENTALSHYHQRGHSPLPTNRNGPHHGTPAAARTQCHTNHSRPRMFTRSHLPPLFRHHHGPWNCPTLLRLRLPMVRPTNKDDKRPRPQVHLTIWQSAHQETWNPMKPIHRVPPPNRWTVRMKEPVDRAIFTAGNLKRP